MLRKEGQASIEAMLILAAVLITVSTLQLGGKNMAETTNVNSAAKEGVQTSITKISIQNGIDLAVSDWEKNNDNLVFYLTVQGDPPPTDNEITGKVENIAQTHLEETVGGGYTITAKIEKRVRK